MGSDKKSRGLGKVGIALSVAISVFLLAQYECYYPKIHPFHRRHLQWLCVVKPKGYQPEAITGNDVVISGSRSLSFGAASNAGTFYADLICKDVDPEFWNNFDLAGAVTSQVSEQTQRITLVRIHKYKSITVAEQDIKKFWGTPDFNEAARFRVNATNCGNVLTEKNIKLEQYLNKPAP